MEISFIVCFNIFIKHHVYLYFLRKQQSKFGEFRIETLVSSVDLQGDVKIGNTKTKGYWEETIRYLDCTPSCLPEQNCFKKCV